MRDPWMIPLIWFFMFFMPVMAFLGGSIYAARQPIDVAKIVYEVTHNK